MSEKCSNHHLEFVTSFMIGNPKQEKDTTSWDIKYCKICKQSVLFVNGVESEKSISQPTRNK